MKIKTALFWVDEFVREVIIEKFTYLLHEENTNKVCGFRNYVQYKSKSDKTRVDLGDCYTMMFPMF